MRILVITLNTIVAIFFLGFLSYTFVARQHVEGLARNFVTEKTLKYSAPIVDVAEESLKSRMVRTLLTGKRLEAVQHEIAAYRQDPARYIADLTRQAKMNWKPEKPNPLLVKVAAIKERIRTYYDNTLNALIDDLRIFAVSNLCAGIIALGLAWRSHQKVQQRVVWFSFLMFASVLYGSCMYVDDLTFFRILFRTHMGWWYPMLLCVTTVSLFQGYGELWEVLDHSKSDETTPVPAPLTSNPDDSHHRSPAKSTTA